MLRTIVPALTLLGCAWLAGCSASNSDAAATSRGGSSSVGGGAGATSNAGGAQGGSAGAQGLSNGGSAGAIGGSGSAAGGVSVGSGGSLGATGGAGTGAAGSAGSSGTAPLFSDDFEGATIDTTKWTARINNGSAMFDLDTTQKHGGKQSLHVKQTGFSSMLAAEGAPIFPAPGNSYYGRVWIRVEFDMGVFPMDHVVWVETGDVTNDTHEVRVGANLGHFQSNLYYMGEVDIRDPAAAMTLGTWHCIQFHYGNDLLDVTLDGVHSSISTTNWVAADSINGNTAPRSNWAPTYAAFRIGWELGHGEAWYDDVALDRVPVSCN